MMLLAATLLFRQDAADHRTLLQGLKPHVEAAPTLIAIVDEHLKPRPENLEHRRWRAESTERKVEKTKRDLAGLVEEADAGMRQLMAAAPGSGTGGAQAQDAQQAVSRLFEGVMATNKRFADALLDRAGPGPAVELQRRFVHEYFDALARGGTLLLRAAGEAAEQSQERQKRERSGQEGAGGKAAPAGRSSEPAPVGASPRPPTGGSRAHTRTPGTAPNWAARTSAGFQT